MLTSVQIRQQFLDFFKSKAHQIVPSAPIVLKNDPTLLFTNAGMNQFKDYFLGNKQPAHTRVADTQKCLRVSGKHNDLEEVGIDTYHHTMFEMLGNWSFGDYFKKEAIAWGWELLTKVYGIPEHRLYVTIFEGDEKEGLPEDKEAYGEWKKWIAEDRILRGNKKDNFWEMGDTGPCGPCSEIHVDCRSDEEREQVNGKTLVNAGDPQVIEIWNIVFIQFNRLKNGSLEPLPARHVDTGMGLERLVRVLQGKQSNYDTDLFTPTLTAIEKLTGIKYNPAHENAVAFRVIADHIRAICFTIADGQLPSNTGAGYVIRRILRRAVRYYYSYLGVRQPLLHELVTIIARQFEHVFPELQQQEDFVKKVIYEEENNFLRTLESGIKRIEEFMAGSEKKVIDGNTAFELYDTYGFPLDLTNLIAAENKFTVDEKGFDAAMQEQKSRSLAAGKMDTDDWTVLEEGPVKFVGYNETIATSRLRKYRKIKAKGKEQYQLVLDQTPFYAESGGQVGDTGTLDFGGEIIPVTDTRKENDLIVHFTPQLPQDPQAAVKAQIDTGRRDSTALNHSATHLLHAALRKVLGTHVQQKGSLVDADHLRFDFSHYAAVTPEALKAVEAIVNQKIRENIPVVIKEMDRQEALQTGAMALFGEKYGDRVRVVIMDPGYSIELCGGTHVQHTGEIGTFIITAETAVAAGVRRIEAVTGQAALEYVHDSLIAPLERVKKIIKKKYEEAPAEIEKLITENSALKKKIAKLEAGQLTAIQKELLQKAETIGHISFIGAIVEVGSGDMLKQLCFACKNAFPAYLIVLAANIEGRAQVAVMMDDNTQASKGWNAGQIIKEQVAPLISGGGGGQPSFATAGGQDATRLQEVITRVRAIIG